MGIFKLSVAADLENVKEVIFPDDVQWTVDIQHSGGEEYRRGVTLTKADAQDIPNSRGKAHFLVRWDGSKHFATIDIKPTYHNYKAADKQRAVVAEFECRGLVPLNCFASSPVTVVSSSGKVFTDVDLSEGEWSDYDEDAAVPVGIYDMKFEFC